MGFSPVELPFSPSVRDQWLREMWTKELRDPKGNNTYQCVIDLKERFEETCELAKQSLQKSSQRNKLLTQWKRPFTIVTESWIADYKIDTQLR